MAGARLVPARWPRDESRERWAAYVRRAYGDGACGAKGLRGSGLVGAVRLSAPFFGLGGLGWRGHVC